jgi:cyclopropane-fatty-acyl-phospholipid synthase
MAPRTVAERDAVARTSEAQREHERRLVAHHYEHNPEIFALVLGRELLYSTGAFLSDDDDLDTAQDRKLARVAAKLDVREGEMLLDVGCGWGSILLHTAKQTNGRVWGVTLSARQREVALARAETCGVSNRVRIDLAHIDDLTLVPESLDAVVFSGSIVHMHNRERVYERIAYALRPGGRLLVSDCFFPQQLRGNRESKATEYIFVTALGYCRLLSLSEELALMERVGLDVLHVEDFTRSYVLTVNRWIDNVRRHRDRIDALAPGFAQILQTYMTIGRLSFHRRSALEYMILAVKGRPRVQVGAWPIPGSPA